MNKQKQNGVTLIELTVVLLILVALAGLVSPYVGGTGQKAMCEATDISMQNIKKVIMENYYVDTLGKYPATKDTQNYNLTCLFNACGWQDFDSVTNVGFRKGGYLQSGVVLNANPDSSFQDNTKVNSSILANQTQILDAWGKPIVLQVLLTSQNCQSITGMNDCARLVSAGFDGVIETLISDTVNTPPELKRKGDDRIVYLNIPTPSGEQNTPCDQY